MNLNITDKLLANLPNECSTGIPEFDLNPNITEAIGSIIEDSDNCLFDGENCPEGFQVS